MTPAFKRANAAPASPLREFLLAVTYRGDVQYSREPGAGTFAVLDLYRGRKAFFAEPHGVPPEGLRALIEDHFGAPVERVTESLWSL
jgi:hypothetical protein